MKRLGKILGATMLLMAGCNSSANEPKQSPANETAKESTVQKEVKEPCNAVFKESFKSKESEITALANAVLDGDSEKIKQLLAEGANINEKTKEKINQKAN